MKYLTVLHYVLRYVGLWFVIKKVEGSCMDRSLGLSLDWWTTESSCWCVYISILFFLEDRVAKVHFTPTFSDSVLAGTQTFLHACPCSTRDGEESTRETGWQSEGCYTKGKKTNAHICQGWVCRRSCYIWQGLVPFQGLYFHDVVLWRFLIFLVCRTNKMPFV